MNKTAFKSYHLFAVLCTLGVTLLLGVVGFEGFFVK